MDDKIHCFCCGKIAGELTFVGPGHEYISAHYSVIFDSTGNYGSTKVDMIGNRRIIILICDDCFVAKKDLAVLETYRKPRKINKLELGVDLDKLDMYNNDDLELENNKDD